MVGGVVSQRTEGTPQGGPLSPLFSNILLDDLYKEFEKRSQAFCRYADDCNIYVQSKRAGERVLSSVTQFLSKRLKLKVNQTKISVARPLNRKFLCYIMTFAKHPRLKFSPASVIRFKSNLKDLFRAGRGRNLSNFITEFPPVFRVCVNYFRLS